MPPYAGPSTAARSGDVAGTLKLLAYLALSVTLILLDHRGGWLNQARRQAAVLVQPLWLVAGLPGRLMQTISEDAGTISSLTEENRRLRNELLVSRARMARLASVASDNARLRGLLAAAQQGALDAQLAPVLDIDLEPTRQRLVLDAGSSDGVRVGQSVIDAGGLIGQIIDTTPMHATVLLLTDPSHAVPVALARNGVRLVAYGTGRTDRLQLSNVPLSTDIKVGDVLVTSGLGGRFAAGFPIGTVTALRPDESRAFLVGDVRPAAQLDRGRDVLILRTAPARPVIGPTAPLANAGAVRIDGLQVEAPPAPAAASAPAPASAAGQGAGPTPASPAAQTPPGAGPPAATAAPPASPASPATAPPGPPSTPPATGERR
ncbi:rod shape-determining protein MreC [Cognatilysobacter tabacisoli]|uniref:rod shape-determining protein MreC n=1 Tax=Cognatilysobacter tabacisoli TaxID=2315424 RepID=UPI000E6B259D|nr:rod shape-determining protein MreC [Lysobacter tabacisoli]